MSWEGTEVEIGSNLTFILYINISIEIDINIDIDIGIGINIDIDIDVGLIYILILILVLHIYRYWYCYLYIDIDIDIIYRLRKVEEYLKNEKEMENYFSRIRYFMNKYSINNDTGKFIENCMPSSSTF